MRAVEFLTEAYDTTVFRMAKLQKDGRVVRILRHADQVSFSDNKGWLLIDTTPGKARPETMKWIPDTTAFDWVREFNSAESVEENFADGKVKGRSRPGRVKRAGASCNGSVTDLRARAKRASGEKAKMYHWCANMKSGKKNESEMDEDWKKNVATGVLGAGMALGGGTAQADTDVFNKKLTPAEIQQIQTKADLTQRYYNELVRRAKEDGRIMDRATLNMLKAKAQDAAARSVQQQPQAPQAKSTLPGTQPSEIRRSANYKNFESVKK